MLRSIASIVIGYAVLSIAIMAPSTMMEQMMSPSGNSGAAEIGTTNMMIFSIIINMLAGVVGGYATARIAGYKETEHALALAVVRILVGIIAMSARPNNVPIVLAIVNSVLLLPAAYFGGYLRKVRRVADEGTMTTDI